MNFISKLFRGLTIRGRTLARMEQGFAHAKNNRPDEAIKDYTDVINSSKSPRDVKAMALFNRALVYTTISKERQATADLKAVLSMPEATARIKKSATEKLVRMQRKVKRESKATKDNE